MTNALLRFFKIAPRIKKVHLQRPTRPPKNFPHQGEHYHLKELYDQINHKYFESKLDLKIMWVGNKHSKPRRRVMFGSYNPDLQLIKIHRRLDQPHIPPYFISFVIYHEMLHHVAPPLKNRRKEKRRIHHSAFSQKEREFEHFLLVKAFRKKNKTVWFSQT